MGGKYVRSRAITEALLKFWKCSCPLASRDRWTSLNYAKS